MPLPLNPAGQLLSYRDTVTTSGAFNLTVIDILARRRARHMHHRAIVSAAGVGYPRGLLEQNIEEWLARQADLHRDTVDVRPYREFLADALCEVWEWARSAKFRHDNEVAAAAERAGVEQLEAAE